MSDLSWLNSQQKKKNGLTLNLPYGLSFLFAKKYSWIWLEREV